MRGPLLLLVVLSTAGCGRVGYPRQERDASTFDASTFDASTFDAGTLDAGVLDAGTLDAGTLDAGTLDAGVDAPADRAQVLVITDDLDDGELETSGTFGTGGYAPQGERNGWLYMGGFDQAGGPGLTVGYFRFRVTEPIARGQVITDARLRLFGTDTWLHDPDLDHQTIAAENAADPLAPSSIADIPLVAGGRPLTTARVRWPAAGPLDWSIGAWNESESFAPVMQELVDRYGLPAGAHVMIFVYREGGAMSGEVAAEDFSNDAPHHAELVLRWR